MAEVAKCPQCGCSIDGTQRSDRCPACQGQLPDSIQRRLPALADSLRPVSVSAAPLAAAGHARSTRAETNDAYKVVPFIGQVDTGFFSSDNATTVAQQLQAAIAREMSAGWEFHSFAKVDVEVRPGCIASLFGAHASYVTFDQLVFRYRASDFDPTRSAAGASAIGASVPQPASCAPAVSPEERTAEVARGIFRCKRCDKIVETTNRQFWYDKELCNEHLSHQ